MQLYKLCTAQGDLAKEHVGAKEQCSPCVQSDQKSVISHYHKEAIETSISPEATKERDQILQAALMNLDLRVVGNNWRFF